MEIAYRLVFKAAQSDGSTMDKARGIVARAASAITGRRPPPEVAPKAPEGTDIVAALTGLAWQVASFDKVAWQDAPVDPPKKGG